MFTRNVLIFAAALTIAACLTVVSSTGDRASAAVFTVTVAGDSADGVCDGHCSLREAVLAANANITTIDTISIPAGTYTLSLNAAENALNPASSKDLDIQNNNTTINGAGAGSTIIDANYIDRIFEVHLNKFVTINNVTLKHGAPIGQGGALTAAGGSTVNLNAVIVAENQANDGGGIWNGGSMAIAGSTIRDNIASNGGGIFNGSNASIILNGVTLYGNQAGGAGGGALYNDNVAHVWNSTISDNYATNGGGGGGGILNYNTTDLNLQNVTLSNNSSSSADKGGGIRNFGSADLWNTIVANNAGGGGNCSPVGPYSQVAVNSAGDNIDFGAANCGFGNVGDSGGNPNLGPLQNNGGSTLTRALLPGSAAIDTETNGGNCFATDQRGITRPQGPACDIGSFEVGAAATPTPSPTPAPTPTPSPTPAPTPSPSPSPTPTPPPTSDMDGDGWTAAAETIIGTGPSDPCGSTGWPADIIPMGIQPNTLNIQDLGSFVTPIRHLGTSQGEQNFDKRWDLIPGSTVGKHINISDLASLVVGSTGYPPMFGGLRAYGKTCPYPP